MVGTLFSRVSGLLREVLLVALFPVRVSDAFRIAWTVPNLFRELLAEGALTNAFVPVYHELSREERRRFSGAVASALLLVNALLLALTVWAAPWVVDLLLADASNVDVDLAVRLTRIVFPVLMAISFSALAMGILNSEERFLAPAWAPVALNLVTIALMLAFPGQALWLGLGVVLGGVAQFLVQLPALWRFGLFPRLGRLWHSHLPLVLALMAPFAFTTGARQFLNVVAQRLVSNEQLFPAGAVTAYGIAGMLFSLVLGLFSISPAVAYYSRLAADVVSRPERVRVTLQEGLRLITFLCVPAGLLLFAFSDPIVGAIFMLLEPAAGQERTIALAVAAVGPLGFAVFPVGLNNLLIRPFYTRKRVRSPVAIVVVFTLLTAALFALFAPRFGIRGLSYALALAGWLQLGVLLLWMRRDEGLELRAFLGHAARVWLAAGLAVLPAAVAAGWAAELWLGPEAGWWRFAAELALGGALTAALYLAAGTALGLPELERLTRRLRP